MPRSLIALLLLVAGEALASPADVDVDSAGLSRAALGCAQRTAADCLRLAEHHRNGPEPSPLREAVVRTHACEGGHLPSCSALGLSAPTSLAEALASPPPMEVADPAGIALLLDACDRGVLDACLAVARQVNHDVAGDLAQLVLEPLRSAQGSNTARELLRDQRWLDEPLPTHLWRAAEPLGAPCEAGDDEACALGRRVLALERASAKPIVVQKPLPMTPPRAEATRTRPPRWIEATVPLGAGATFTRALPLLSLGLGVRGGVGAFAASLDLAFLPEANKAPLDMTYRRSVLALGAGAAIPLAPFAILHLGAAFAMGDWTSAPEGSRFSFGPQESIELSWVLRPGHLRSPTLGLRVQVHQLVDAAGTWDHVGAVRFVLGVRFLSARR